MREKGERVKQLRIVLLIGALLVSGSVTLPVQASEDPTFSAAFAVRVIAALTESYVGSLVETMHTLSATNELRSGTWDEMVDLISAFEESVLTFDAWFLQPDGVYYKVGTGLQAGNLSDRSYFSTVMAGEATLGDLVHSRSTGRKSMVLTVPIIAGEHVIGALGVTLYLEELGALIADAIRLPSTVSFYATGQDGLIALYPSDAQMLLEPGSEAEMGVVSGGIQISPSLGWTFVLGTPAE